jgi:hypothetical protein
MPIKNLVRLPLDVTPRMKEVIETEAANLGLPRTTFVRELCIFALAKFPEFKKWLGENRGQSEENQIS